MRFNHNRPPRRRAKGVFMNDSFIGFIAGVIIACVGVLLVAFGVFL